MNEMKTLDYYLKSNKKGGYRINSYPKVLTNPNCIRLNYCGGNDWLALFYNNYCNYGTAFNGLKALCSMTY